MEQAVVVQTEHVLQVAFHRVFERAGEKPDLLEAERSGGEGNLRPELDRGEHGVSRRFEIGRRILSGENPGPKDKECDHGRFSQELHVVGMMFKSEEPILLFEPGTKVSHSAKEYVQLRIDVNEAIA